ncbi:MGMT family protein [Alteromonas facilis]|uniref:MGMT family protein n=1 Tax=Alteromonas facilis TaxID=2048004 RepID=UPI001F0C722D|nr:MGMT family protein [Alteromonas facilis]
MRDSLDKKTVQRCGAVLHCCCILSIELEIELHRIIAETLIVATESMRRIWRVVQLVPQGKVASYGQIADLAGLPGRARLTSKALGSAPCEMELPWFRILRSDGRIAFERESEMAKRQRDLLLADGVFVNNMKVSLQEFQWHPSAATLLFELDF